MVEKILLKMMRNLIGIYRSKERLVRGSGRVGEDVDLRVVNGSIVRPDASDMREKQERALQPVNIAHPYIGIIQCVMDFSHASSPPVIYIAPVYHVAVPEEPSRWHGIRSFFLEKRLSLRW
jgi:hypothetical protein